jgi:predicted amidophosphoribosyltransferase
MAVVKIRPMKLSPCPWIEGYVLDYQTVSSTPTGDPYYRFDTKRTELGELLFRLKYRAGGSAVVADIADTVEHFLQGWKPPIECVTPAPSSLGRKSQPAVEIVRELAARLQLPALENALVKVKTTPQMKNIDDWSERQRLLGEAIQAGPENVNGKCILVFDDLIESGSTLRRAAEVLLKEGGARAI